MAQHRGLVGRAARALSRMPGGGLLLVPPRAATFGFGSWWSARAGNGAGPRLTPSLLGHVVLDESVLAAMKDPRRYPSDEDLARVVVELARLRALQEREGWTDPLTYNEPPPPLVDPTIVGGWSLGLPFERLSWPSGFEPRAEEVGRERWLAYEPNHTAYAWVLRADPRAPWLVCLHGFGMGQPRADLFALGARRMHRDLGLNLIFPVLPLHGPRRVSRPGGAEMLSAELANLLYGMAQSMWDVRRALSWVRAQGAPMVGVHGISLGAYTAALLATLEPDLDLILAGAPLIDILDLFEQHAPARVLRAAGDAGLLRPDSRLALRPVSPGAAGALVPRERLRMYAGVVDRMTTPQQARRLWAHWGEPEVCWYEGGHLGFLWSEHVRVFVEDALVATGFVSRRRVSAARRRRRAGTGTPPAANSR